MPEVRAVYDAVIAAGGRARRLGGADKPSIEIEGVSILDRVVGACADTATTVVVGPQRPLSRGVVVWARESPVGSGPVAAVAAGVPLTSAPLVLLLAADLPLIAPAVPVLLARIADTSSDAAVLVDSTGRRNLLAAVWRREALVQALAQLDSTIGAPMRAVYERVQCAEVPDPAGWGEDCDTWDDIARARRQLEERTAP